MTRKGFAVSCCALSLAARAVASDAPARPNILSVFADDWGRYASAYAAQTATFASELLARLKAFRDPRVCDDPIPFENPPFTFSDDSHREPSAEKKRGTP